MMDQRYYSRRLLVTVRIIMRWTKKEWQTQDDTQAKSETERTMSAVGLGEIGMRRQFRRRECVCVPDGGGEAPKKGIRGESPVRPLQQLWLGRPDWTVRLDGQLLDGRPDWPAPKRFGEASLVSIVAAPPLVDRSRSNVTVIIFCRSPNRDILRRTFDPAVSCGLKLPIRKPNHGLSHLCPGFD